VEETPLKYGALEPPVTSSDGMFFQGISDKLVCHILSFVGPLVLVFLAEAEDKSQVTLNLHIHKLPRGSTAGALLGVFVATVFAVLSGFTLERQLSDQRLLFLISSLFFGLSLLSLSQSLVHTRAASPEGLQNVLVALLAWGRPVAVEVTS